MLSILAAVALMWIQFIYWFRLFETTTLYIRLIYQTIEDILAFLLIFVLVILTFSNLLYVLNTNRQQGEFGDALYPQAIHVGFIDAILN